MHLLCNSDRVSFKAAQHPAFYIIGQTASLVDEQGQVVGYLGKLHPLVQQKLDLEGAVYIFELLLAPLLAAKLPLNLKNYHVFQVCVIYAIVLMRSIAAGFCF